MAEIEFHDSYLLSVDLGEGAFDLKAWVWRDLTGGEETEGGYQPIRIALRRLTLEGDLGELPFDIYRDKLFIDGVEFRGLLQLPSFTKGFFELTFQCREDAREVTFRGVDLDVTEAGEFQLIETKKF